MNQVTLSRVDGERRAQATLVRLLCAASIWRTIITRILPICGSASWWTALCCLLPGLGVAALLRLTMFLTDADTLMEAMRAALGKMGAAVLAVVLFVLLMTEAVSFMNSLITLFIQGIGTSGTPWSLALLTGGMLLLSLHREGLARGAYLLRKTIAAGVILLAAALLMDAEVDHLFPLYGNGKTAVWQGFEAGFSLAWPVMLFLMVQPAKGRGRLRSTLLPAVVPVGMVLLVTLSIPHEVLMRHDGMANLLMLSAVYMPNSLRVLFLVLLMLIFFLATSASVQVGTQTLLSVVKHPPGWVSYAVMCLLFLTQVEGTERISTLLHTIESWLIVPLAVLALVSWPLALHRRKCP